MGADHFNGSRAFARSSRLRRRATDEIHNPLERSAGLKYGGYSEIFQMFGILIRNDASHQDDHVVHLFLFQQLHQARHNGIVRARQDRKPDDLDILLKRRVDDHFRSLAQAGIDDFHAGIPQRPGDYLRAAIMSIEAGFSYQHPDSAIHIQFNWKPSVQLSPND